MLGLLDVDRLGLTASLRRSWASRVRRSPPAGPHQQQADCGDHEDYGDHDGDHGDVVRHEISLPENHVHLVGTRLTGPHAAAALRLVSHRQQRGHPATGGSRPGLEGAAELGGPLAHRRQPDPGPPGVAAAVVGDLEVQPVGRGDQRTDAEALVLCRATLVSASVTMRYAATSTAAGRSGNSSGARHLDRHRLRRPGCAARGLLAQRRHQARSSSAGGRIA